MCSGSSVDARVANVSAVPVAVAEVVLLHMMHSHKHREHSSDSPCLHAACRNLSRVLQVEYDLV